MNGEQFFMERLVGKKLKLKYLPDSWFMRMQQDCVKQQNNSNVSLDFDIDFAVSNLLAENDKWKSFVSDKIGGRYFLQDYMNENAEMLQKMGSGAENILQLDSFNPEIDNRLHEYFANRIKRSFDPNFQTKDAIKNNLINYFLTNPGERPGNPLFGAGLRNFIFTQ